MAWPKGRPRQQGALRKATPKAIEGMLGKISRPQLDSMGATCIELFGGEIGFCKFVVEEIRNSKKGSMYRARLVQYVMSMVRFGNENEERIEDGGLLTDEDLVKAINVQMEKVEKPQPEGFFQNTKLRKKAAPAPAEPVL